MEFELGSNLNGIRHKHNFPYCANVRGSEQGLDYIKIEHIVTVGQKLKNKLDKTKFGLNLYTNRFVLCY